MSLCRELFLDSGKFSPKESSIDLGKTWIPADGSKVQEVSVPRLSVNGQQGNAKLIPELTEH